MFSLPMIYVTNMSTGFSAEGVRIGRYVDRRDEAEHIKKLPVGENLVVTPIPEETTVTVEAVYKTVKIGFSRMFGGDYEMAVLQDSNGMISATKTWG